MINEIIVGCPISNSDHHTLTWSLNLRTCVEKSNVTDYNFHKADYTKINAELNAIQWEKALENLSVEDMWVKIKTIVLDCRDRLVPVREARKAGTPAWMKQSIIKGVAKRGKKWKRFQKYRSYNNELKYKSYRNKVTHKIRSTKRDFENNIASRIKDDPKSFFAYVRNKSKSKTKIGPLKNDQGELISECSEMSELLNKYFTTVFTSEDLINIPIASSRAKSNNVEILEHLTIDESSILSAVNRLQDNKSPGVDEINSTFLKGTIGGLLKPLAILFNLSLDRGEIPSDWKDANVAVIFKKGSKTDPSNYRPISLTSQVGKILERIIKDRVVEYLEENQLIYNSQHGFRKNRSCLTNLLEFTEKAASCLDSGKSIDIIYLDFQKAFDKVPHARLMRKLSAIGIIGKLANWVQEWLKDRRQRVILRGKVSNWEKVTSGVPQGSVLGPLLFTVYINDLDEDLINKVSKFADDTKILGEVNNIAQIQDLRMDLDKLFSWANTWQMQFNVTKCKIIHLGAKNKKESFSLGGNELIKTTEEKDLGVIITDNFKVARQCASAAKKGFQMLGMIARTIVSREKAVIIPLYKSLVRPHLDFCVQAWRPHLQKDIDLLERVQRRVTRMVLSCKGLCYEDRLQQLNLTTLETRRMRSDLIEVFKITGGFEGVKEDIFFTRAADSSNNHNTRGNSKKLTKKRVRLDVAKYSFGNRVINDWNSLPDDMVRAGSVDAFKGKLDKFLRHVRGLK
jgi:ribonuclease P/MRP protein subunit RPP40